MLCNAQHFSMLVEKNYVVEFEYAEFSVLIIPFTANPGARPTKHISIELEIRWKFRTL